MTEPLEFEMCCGTVCDKPVALKQIAHLQKLHESLNTEVHVEVSDMDWHSTVPCKLTTNGEVVGTFIPEIG